MAGMRSSYYPNYFSLEDILASEERIPVEVKEDLADLGFLDPGADNKELKRGTKLELPQWMVEGLNTGRNTYLDVEVPKTYREVYREIMTADPLVVDLHKQGPYYYEFGRQLIKQSPSEGEAIGRSITNTFKTRFKKILDSSQNSCDTESLKETQKMDMLERLLYKQGQHCKAGMDAWLTRKTGSIQTSQLVAQQRKRKATFD